MFQRGTYVRTLCADIGDRLKVGGHFENGLQTPDALGPLQLDQAVEMESLNDMVDFSQF